MNFKTYFFVAVLFPASLFSLGQQRTKMETVYDPRETFAQNFYTNNGNEYRSSNGSPGSRYWQNRADYLLDASLDTVKNVLSCNEVIRYINNSPDALQSLWLQLDQNTYRKEARSNFYSEFDAKGHTEGFQLENITLEFNGKNFKADEIVTDTRMQIRLPEILAAKGEIDIHIKYSYTIPGTFGGRTDFFSTGSGKIYEMAQWYPRMCVYDDINGWGTLPFLGSGEFYCEYGDFDYKITVPNDMIVAGSGELQNEKEVLTVQQIQRLAEAEKSDQTVIIRSPEEVKLMTAHPISTGTKTWHFKMSNTRDVAFGASKAYVWDAARVNLPGGKKALAMSVYPPESAGASEMGQSHGIPEKIY